MNFSRLLPRSPLSVLTLITLLLILVTAKDQIRFEGRSGSPYEVDRISNVVITDGWTHAPFARLPADNFRCRGVGQVHCNGQVNARQMDFTVSFNGDGSWACSGSYGGQQIACQGAFYSNDIRTARVTIPPAELGLTLTDLWWTAPDALITPDKSMRMIWGVIGGLYVLALFRYFHHSKEKTVEPNKLNAAM